MARFVRKTWIRAAIAPVAVTLPAGGYVAGTGEQTGDDDSLALHDIRIRDPIIYPRVPREPFGI